MTDQVSLMVAPHAALNGSRWPDAHPSSPGHRGDGGHAHRVTTGGRVVGEGFERTLADARHGDEVACTKLYIELAPVLTRSLPGCGARGPEDATSETLLQVVRDLRSCQGDGSSSGRNRDQNVCVVEGGPDLGASHRADEATRDGGSVSEQDALARHRGPG